VTLTAPSWAATSSAAVLLIKRYDIRHNNDDLYVFLSCREGATVIRQGSSRKICRLRLGISVTFLVAILNGLLSLLLTSPPTPC